MTESPETAATERNLTATSSRRSFLFRAGLLLNALALTAFAIPVVGYLLSPLRRVSFLKWISLGPVAGFPENQTRLAVYTNPFRTPSDGVAADIPCWVRRLTGDSFQVFSTNCSHLGCPVRWFPSPNCSCAHVMAALFMPTANELPALRHALSINTPTKLKRVNCGWMPVRCP